MFLNMLYYTTLFFMGKIKKCADTVKGMNHIKVLLSVFIGTLVYVLISFVAGDNGIVSYNKLNEQKKIVARQTELIQNINNELTLEYTALLRDKDVIAAYARRLDYVGNGEKIVKIKGLKAAETTLYDTGTVVRHKDYECLPEKFCKISALVFFVLAISLALLIDLNNGTLSMGRKKKTVVQGIPVYDLQQI